MGWGNCGSDSGGRPIGYMFQAVCDHPGCNSEIDRGLSYACGGMHGKLEIGCEKYFCEKHLFTTVKDQDDLVSVCEECSKYLLSTKEWAENEEEGYSEYKEQ